MKWSHNSFFSDLFICESAHSARRHLKSLNLSHFFNFKTNIFTCLRPITRQNLWESSQFLQFNFNYRRNNVGLEVESCVESDEIKDFQGLNCTNSSYYHKLKDFHQRIGKKHIEIQIFKNFYFQSLHFEYFSKKIYFRGHDAKKEQETN